MNLNILLGELFSFIAAFFLALSTFRTKKNKMLIFQLADSIFNAISNLFLNSFSGFVVNIFTSIRNYLSIKEKFNKRELFFYVILILIIGIKVNNKGIVGILPIIASVEYSLFMHKSKSSQIMRIALLINLSLWLIYDFFIKSYPMFIMDLVIILITVINIIRFHNKEKASI